MSRIELFHTSSFRLALYYAGLFMASVLVLFAVTYWFAMDYAAQDENSEIADEFASIQDEMGPQGFDKLPAIIANHLRLRKNVRAVYLLQDKEGRKLAGNIDTMMPALGEMLIDRAVDGMTLELRASGYRLGNGDYFLIGEDATTLKEMKALIARAFGVGFAATLSMALAGSMIIGTTVLKRLEGVSRTARAIMQGDMSQRAPVRGNDDEFDALAQSMNAMLDRIEDLMRSMRQVSNDIAHDLRTPLSRLRQKLEGAKLRATTVEELRAAVGHSIAQVDSILETFGALLRIAQIEAGEKAAGTVLVDVSKLVGGIVEDFTPAAEDHGQRLTANVDPELTLIADPELLTQMIVNLIENAIRHSPGGASISVLASAANGALELAVTDTGPGIPLNERENVLRPFYRLEASRTTDGSGLGLSLVAAIAKRHRAKLSLDDNDPGLRIAVSFPIAA